MISFDQAHHLRRIVKGSFAPARVICLVSGKGGVGKSNLAANLSLSLASAGRRTILVDADLGLANQDILFNLPPGPNISTLLKSAHNPAEITTDIAPGLRLVPGASGLTALADLSDFHRARLISFLDSLERSADFLIVDASAGLSSNVVSFAAVADDVLVITTPEPPAITDAYAVIKVLLTERQLTSIFLVVNMAKNLSQVRNVHSRIAGATRRFLHFNLPLAGFVLHDRHVPLAVTARRPFMWSFPRCRAARQVRRLAKYLLDAQPPLQSAQPQDPYFLRAANCLL